MTAFNEVPYIQVVSDVFSDIKKCQKIEVTQYELEHTNNYFEYLDPKKPTHPFLDLDNNKKYKDIPITKCPDEFNKIVLRIEKKLINAFPHLPILNASHFQSKKYVKNPKTYKIELKCTEPKISFRLTDHTKICADIAECKLYCLNEFKEKVQKSLGEDFDYVDCDASVYRGGDGGKMSCVNAYKHYQQKERVRELVNGEIEHTFIQYQFNNEEEVKHIPKPKPKITKPQKSIKTTKKGKIQIKKKLDDKVIEVETPCEELVQKYWDYAKLIDKSKLTERSNWLNFTFTHINILGLGDYDNYDNFLKNTSGYVDLENRMKYEELFGKKEDNSNHYGWKYLYNLAYDNDKDNKIKLDQIYREPYSLWTCLKQKSKSDNSIKTKEEIEEEINKIIDNEDFSKKAKDRKVKEIKDKHKKDQEEQEEQTYKDMKPYFELYHFKLAKPMKFCRLTNDYDVVDLLPKKTFCDLHENLEIKDKVPFTDKWLRDPTMKTYDKLDFIPYGMSCPKQTFNLFDGFRIEKIRSTEKHSFNHILETIKLNAGDNEDMYNYLLKYAAHLVQKPAILPKTAIVVVGEQGTGKSSYWENFGKKILGDKYTLQSSKADDIVGKFNVNKNKLLVIMEETEGKNTFLSCSQIKTLITQEDNWWEGKGKDAILMKNCGRMIFISNNRTPVKIEQSDRRFVVTETSNRHKQDKEFFTKVMNEWNDDIAVKNFYEYLMSVDISNFDAERDRVITEAYKDMQVVTIPTIAKYLEWKYYFYDNAHKCLSRRKAARDLFDDYITWMKQSGYNADTINTTSFGRDIKRYEGITKKRGNGGVVYCLEWNEIFEDLKKKGFIEEIEKDEDIIE